MGWPDVNLVVAEQRLVELLARPQPCVDDVDRSTGLGYERHVVLHMLMAYNGQVVKREQVLEDVWNDTESNSNIVDVYIRRLRVKLEVDAEKPRHIVSVRGIGYKFVGK